MQQPTCRTAVSYNVDAVKNGNAPSGFTGISINIHRRKLRHSSRKHIDVARPTAMCPTLIQRDALCAPVNTRTTSWPRDTGKTSFNAQSCCELDFVGMSMFLQLVRPLHAVTKCAAVRQTQQA
jgi:hypothetical protein